MPAQTPGRSRPTDYRYGARALAAPATLHAESLWVARGLYGNLPAFEALEARFLEERGEGALVLNGDFHFHWFDASGEAFAGIEGGVALYAATRGTWRRRSPTRGPAPAAAAAAPTRTGWTTAWWSARTASWSG